MFFFKTVRITFHINFVISLSSSIKNIEILIKITFHLYIDQGYANSSIILNLLFHEHDTALHLFKAYFSKDFIQFMFGLFLGTFGFCCCCEWDYFSFILFLLFISL